MKMLEEREGEQGNFARAARTTALAYLVADHRPLTIHSPCPDQAHVLL